MRGGRDSTSPNPANLGHTAAPAARRRAGCSRSGQQVSGFKSRGVISPAVDEGAETLCLLQLVMAAVLFPAALRCVVLDGRQAVYRQRNRGRTRSVLAAAVR